MIPKKIDPNGQYLLTINNKVRVDDNVVLMPRNKNVVKGRVLEQIKDNPAVLSAELVAPKG